MNIINLNEAEVRCAAQEQFPQHYIDMNTCDLFLADIDHGKINLMGVDHELYVSTHYVYEDRLVNGNKTRYKITLTLINLKSNPYEVIYNSKGKCYVAVQNEDTISFVLYEEFNDFLKPFIEILEEE